MMIYIYNSLDVLEKFRAFETFRIKQMLCLESTSDPREVNK